MPRQYTGRRQVGVRLLPDLLAAVDEFADEDEQSRTDTIVAMLEYAREHRKEWKP